MKSTHKFILTFGILFLIIIVLAVYILKDQPVILLGVELVLVFSLIFVRKIYLQIFQPIELAQQGIAALEDEDFNIKLIKTGSTDVDKMVSVYNEMIDKIRSERVYQQEQHFFLNQLIQALPLAIIILDYDHNISEFNQRAVSLLGLHSKHIGNKLNETSISLADNLMGLRSNTPTTIRSIDNRYYSCITNDFIHRGFARRFILVQENSQQVLETEKKAYGKVIRMMAHEVNNSVGAINSILDSLLSEKPINNDQALEYLPIVHERLNHLNTFMKNFSGVIKMGPPRMIPLNLSALVKRVTTLMQLSAKQQGTAIQTTMPPEDVHIHGDSDQLEQVLINIIKNAMEAISINGAIQIELLDSPITLTIKDNGHGISDEIRPNLFTPFFSTKQNGQGIGLTLVRDVLFRHTATYSLSSTNGWTSFVIRFTS